MWIWFKKISRYSNIVYKKRWKTENVRKEAGRFIGVTVKIESIEFELVCVYGPNGISERKEFYEELNTNLGTTKIHILGGDLNFHEALSDKRGGNPDQGIDGKEEFDCIKQNYNLYDAFREKHGNKEEYTWENGRGADNVKVRLDRFFVTKGLELKILDVRQSSVLRCPILFYL